LQVIEDVRAEAVGGDRAPTRPLRRGMAALDDARGAIARSFAPGDRALQPFAQESAALQQLLTDAAPTLTTARQGFATSERLLGAASDLAAAATRTLPRAPGALASASRLLRDAPAALRPTRRLLAEVRPTVDPVLDLLNAADPVLDPLDRTFTTLRPPVQVLGPYGCDISGFAVTWRSLLGFARAGGGPVGPLTSIRLTAIGSAGSVLGPSGPATAETTSLSDPYPTPCKEYGKPGTADYEPDLQLRPSAEARGGR
jgi:hypothetical protein